MRVITKKGNKTGKSLNAQTEIAFKEDLAYKVGLIIKIMHTNKSNNIKILFDFSFLIIYNIF